MIFDTTQPPGARRWLPRDACPGSSSNPVSAAPSATFSQPVMPSTVSFTVQDSGGNTVAGTVSFNAADTVATFTPTSSLAGGTTYTATVSGAQDGSGTPMSSPYSWSFTTGAWPVPVQYLAGRDADGRVGHGRYQRG